MIERYVVGINESDFRAICTEAEEHCRRTGIYNPRVQSPIEKLTSDGQLRDGVFVLSTDELSGDTSRGATLARLKSLLLRVAGQYKIPQGKLHVYKEETSFQQLE